MYDLELEQLHGFETPANLPFLPHRNRSDRDECNDSILNMTAHLQRLDELTNQLLPPDLSKQNEHPSTVPFQSKPRQYTRLPVPETSTQADFYLHGRRYKCRLVEMSIGGFGILLPRTLSAHAGTLGRLQAPGMHFIVSVTRGEPRADGYFIGLKQIEEILEDRVHPLTLKASAASYLIAGVAGLLIATISFLFMSGRTQVPREPAQASTQSVL